MAAFKGSAPQGWVDETKATARLPGLDIEIVHRESPAGDREMLSVHLQATPSFDALAGGLARFLPAADPFAFWAEAVRLAWLPWTGALRAALPPERRPPALSKPGAARKRRSR